MDSKVCVVQTVGKRYGNKQEDRYFVYKDEIQSKYMIIGVFDGHGGEEVSESLKKIMLFSLKIYLDWCIKNDKGKINLEYLKNLFFDINEYLFLSKLRSGAVCALAIIFKNKIITLHVGDCKVLIFDENGNVMFETNDHTCFNTYEKNRLIKNFGQNIVIDNRVSGILAPTRAFGDFDLPDLDAIKPEPEINVVPITKQVKYLIVGSDGLFDHVDENSNIFFKRSVKQSLQKGQKCLCKHIYNVAMENALDHCNHDSCYDNLTFILYHF